MTMDELGYWAYWLWARLVNNSIQANGPKPKSQCSFSKKEGPKPNAYVEGYEKKSLHFLWFGIGLAVSFSSFFTSLETKYIVL